jgi:amino acid permease
VQNVVATYVGLAVYVLLYVGYTIYQRIAMPGVPHFVPLLEADLDSDAVWGPGEGAAIKEQEAQKRKEIMAHGSWRERMATFFD